MVDELMVNGPAPDGPAQTPQGQALYYEPKPVPAKAGVFAEVEVLGRLIKNITDAARTDEGYDGEWNLYWDSSNTYLRMQFYSIEDASWHAFDPTEHLTTLYAPIGAAYITDGADATLTAEVNGAALVNSGNADALHVHAHSAVTGQTANDHHNEAHTVASHSDTTGTGAELNTLTGGGSTTLHTHSHDNLGGVSANDHHNESHTVVSHSDTTATGSELNTLTDGSNADSLHVHSGLSTAAVSGSDYTNTTGTPSTVVSFTGATNTEYAIWGCLLVTSSASDPMDLDFSVPASAAADAILIDGLGSTDEAGGWSEGSTGTFTTTTSAQAAHFSGVVTVAGTGGTVALQASLNGPSGTLTIGVGSWMAYQAL